MILLALCSLAGCIDRTRVNGKCEWSPEAAGPLDLRIPEHEQHLYEDVELAEELAVRYADLVHKARGGYEGHGGLLDNHGVVNGCIESLLTVIATTHHIPLERVREARMRGHRHITWDATVIVTFGVLYVFVASRVVRLIFRRFQADERWPALAAIVLASFGVSAAGLFLGGLWSVALEMIRVGNDHLGSRGLRIPWDNHLLEIYAAGLVMFWTVATVHWRAAMHDKTMAEVPRHAV